MSQERLLPFLSPDSDFSGNNEDTGPTIDFPNSLMEEFNTRLRGAHGETTVFEEYEKEIQQVAENSPVKNPMAHLIQRAKTDQLLQDWLDVGVQSGIIELKRRFGEDHYPLDQVQEFHALTKNYLKQRRGS